MVLSLSLVSILSVFPQATQKGTVQASEILGQDSQIRLFYRKYEEVTRRLDADGLKRHFQQSSSKNVSCRLPNDSEGFDTMTLGEFISNVRQFHGLVKRANSVEAKVLSIKRSQGSILVKVRYRESYDIGTGSSVLKFTREAEGLDLWQPTKSGAQLRSYRIQSETSKSSKSE